MVGEAGLYMNVDFGLNPGINVGILLNMGFRLIYLKGFEIVSFTLF